MNDRTRGSAALLGIVGFLVYYTVWTLFLVGRTGHKLKTTELSHSL
jgi:hypothetical protein